MGDTYLGFEKNDLVVRSLAAGTYTPTEFSIYRGAKGWKYVSHDPYHSGF